MHKNNILIARMIPTYNLMPLISGSKQNINSRKREWSCKFGLSVLSGNFALLQIVKKIKSAAKVITLLYFNLMEGKSVYGKPHR